jgi:tripartite-type tricarboxylate transporter receptor subunit TctC
MRRGIYSYGLVTAFFASVLLTAPAVAQQDFYKGKTLRFVVGYSPGGGFDIYTRAIARHINKHIPGNPTTMVQNQPGAGGLITANTVYKVAKPDGLTIGNFIGSLVIDQVLDAPGIEFDARKFEWVGVPMQESNACVLTKASGITSLEKWKSSPTPVKIGATAPGDPTYNIPLILKQVLGVPVQVVGGYKGIAGILVAAESGEIAGACWQWESIKTTWRKALDAGEVSVVVQINRQSHPELPNVPNAVSLAKDDAGRSLLQAGILDPAAITRLYALPPGTPKDRVQILRKAFLDTMKDPEFLEEAKKLNIEVKPMSGEDLAKLVAGLFSLPPDTVKTLKTLRQGTR